MARQPLRTARATAAQLAIYTGPAGEPITNTDTGVPHWQDGQTVGGVPLVPATPRGTKALGMGNVAYVPAYKGGPNLPDSGAALDAARAATSTGDLIRLPGKAGDNYNFPNGFTIDGRVIDPDPGLTVNGVADLSTGSVTRTLLIKRNQSGVVDQHYYVPDVYRLPAEKSLWLSPEAGERTSYSVIDQTGAIYFDAPWDSDTVTAFTPTSTASDSATWPAPASWRGTVVPLRGGQEVGGVFNASADAGLSRCAYIQGTAGAAWIWAGSAAASISIVGRVRGAGRTNVASGITWPELGVDPAWATLNCLWAVRAISQTVVEVLLNGIIVTRFDMAAAGLGFIQATGFMTYGSGASAAAGVGQMYRARRRHRRGLPNARLLLIGDSKTDPYFHANWPAWLGEWLDGTAGLRVTGIDNRAISGETSAQQLARLQSVGTGAATDAVIYIGTNDVRYGVPAATTVANVSAMIGALQSGGLAVTLVIPDLWFDKSVTPGATYGLVAANGERGAATRAALIRLGAASGVTVVDLQQITGQVRCDFVGTPTSFTRDNLHPSTFGSRVLCRAIAEGMLAARAAMNTALPLGVVPTTWQMNGWTYNTSIAPSFSISEDGLFQMGGALVVNPSQIGAGTAVLQLPPVYRPQRQYQTPCWTDGSQSGLLIIEKGGLVKVYGVSGGTNLYFDSPVWPLA